MSKHKPIRFKNDSVNDQLKIYFENFIKNNQFARSASQTILVMAVLGGILTISLVAPGFLEVLGRFTRNKQKEKRERYKTLWRSFHSLKKSRALEYVGESEDGELLYRMTNSGETKIKRFFIETLELAEPKKWDGKWRVVVSDIPEKNKYIRKVFQRKILKMGFYPMQKSVWVHPFPCEEEITFLKDFLNIKSCVEVLIVPDMPNGKVLYHFKDILKKTV